MRLRGRNNDSNPIAQDVELTSSASPGGYNTDDVIEATVTFSHEVDVTGIPTLALEIGDNSRNAAYASGGGSSSLVFEYTVVTSDYDANGVSVPAEALELPAGTSITKQGTNANAVLNFLSKLKDDLDHKVNAPPTILPDTGLRFTSTPAAEPDTYGLGETIETSVTFDVPVYVDTAGGTPRLTIRMGSASDGYQPRTAGYVRGSGSAILVFAYVVQSGDMDPDGVSVASNQLDANSGTIRDVNDRDALLEHKQRRKSANHKVDAGLTSPSVAALGGLALSPGTLDPGFTATNFEYTAMVAKDIGVTTVTAIAPSSVTVTIAPADAEVDTVGHQVTLVEGDNEITVTSSAAGALDLEYVVTVTRAANQRPKTSNRSVTIDEDTPHVFAVDQFDFRDDDPGDVLTSIKVVTLPGEGELTLDDAEVVAQDVVSAADIGKLVFTPAENEFSDVTGGISVYASFRFRVSDGSWESRAVIFKVYVEEVNDSPGGEPGIGGNAQAGATLTAVITGITDADGLVGVTYVYQWIRVDGSTETDIVGATENTYLLTGDDVGKTIRVRVSFTDQNQNDEELTSDVYPGNGTIAAEGMTTGDGVCGRTAAVRDAIVAKISSVSDCADVTDGQLGNITGSLLLNSKGIAGLAAGDFAGLTALQYLYLNSNDLSTLPEEVFAGLTVLEQLYLSDNKLSMLPAGVFAGLTALEDLYLAGNSTTLMTLPAGIFGSLTALKKLRLENNSLNALPGGLFDGLAALTELNLSSNRLEQATLPAGIFEPLTALTSLDMNGQRGGQRFNPEAVAVAHDGKVSSAGGTVGLDGSGSGGPWGTNVTYEWALSDPANGLTVNFDDHAGVSPQVTIPAWPAGSVLTFTLTVSVSAAAGGIDPDTATATVMVNTAPQASDWSITIDEDAAHTFSSAEFDFTDTDAGDTLASVTVVTLPAAGELTLDSAAVAAGDTVSEADIGKLVFTPAVNANGAPYASFTFKVSDGTQQSTSSYTVTVNVTAVDDPGHGRADNQRHGAGGRDADGDDHGHRRRGRAVHPGLRLRVDPGRWRHGDADCGRDRRDLHPERGGRGQDDQGAGQLHRRQRQQRGGDQRRLSGERDDRGCRGDMRAHACGAQCDPWRNSGRH